MTVVSQSDRITDMRRRFDDVEDFICWGEIAEAYFDRSASWFYRYCPQNVCKLQSSYICGDIKNQIKNNEAYNRTKIGNYFRNGLE